MQNSLVKSCEVTLFHVLSALKNMQRVRSSWCCQSVATCFMGNVLDAGSEREEIVQFVDDGYQGKSRLNKSEALCPFQTTKGSSTCICTEISLGFA